MARYHEGVAVAGVDRGRLPDAERLWNRLALHRRVRVRVQVDSRMRALSPASWDPAAAG